MPKALLAPLIAASFATSLPASNTDDPALAKN